MATYYIDAGAGNDSNAGTSPGPGNAWATITKAGATVAAGDLVYVKSGIYAEQPAFSTAGTATAPIIFRGYVNSPGDLDTDNLVYTGGRIGNASRPTLTGSNTRNYCLTFTNTVANYQFHNFVLTAPTGAIYRWDGGATSTQFYNTRLAKGAASVPLGTLGTGFTSFEPGFFFCEFDGLNTGLNIGRCYACEIHDLVGASSSFAVGVGNFNRRDLLYCVLYNLPGGGISFLDTDSQGLVVGNTFYNLGNDAIRATGRIGNSFTENTVLGNLAANIIGRPINWVNGANPTYLLYYGGTAYYNCSQAPLLPGRWNGGHFLGADHQLSANPFQAVGFSNFNVVTTEAFQTPFPPGWPRGVMNSQRPFGASVGTAPNSATLIVVED